MPTILPAPGRHPAWARARASAARALAGRPPIRFLAAVWRLSRPFWTAPEERAAAWTLGGLLLAAKLAGVWICVRQNHWYSDFYAALQARDAHAFTIQVAFFALIAGGFVAAQVAAQFLADRLKLRWRGFMVREATTAWLRDRAYYRLEAEGGDGLNPDQRIAEDVTLFTGQTVALVTGFLDVSVSLLAFSGILWALSGTVEVAGVTVAGYLVFAAVGYTLAASLVVHRVGRPLAGLHSAHQALEADFRYGLSRLRENAETVAFYRGETQETALLAGRWGRVAGNALDILRRERSLAWFTQSYGQASLVVPFLLAAPRYFSGGIGFAQVMQIAAAFGSVQACLAFFIASYGQIAQWRATTDRLAAFRDAVEAARAARRTGLSVQRGGEGLAVRDLALTLPDRTPLVDNVALALRSGEAVLVKGPSGTGKSTLLRALAGLWPHADGHATLGEGEAFFVPQRPYLPLGTLRAAVFYPQAPGPDDGAVADALAAVGLSHLVPRLDAVEPWSRVLSGGEQQRLAFARLLLARPATIFLDEATSALDEESERRMYELLREAPWRPTLVSIGHRSTLHAFHDATLELRRAA